MEVYSPDSVDCTTPTPRRANTIGKMSPNPVWAVPMAQQDMSLCQGISTAAFPPKAIGMAVGVRFRDGIETEQVESLQSSIRHVVCSPKTGPPEMGVPR